MTNALELYRAGDAEALRDVLSESWPIDRLLMLVALGRYREAVAEGAAIGVGDERDPGDFEWLNRINLSEAFVELGEFERARALLDPGPGDDAGALVRAGAQTALSWLHTTTGDHEGALKIVQSVIAADLGLDFQAEVSLTRALVSLNLGRLDEARAAIDECRRVTVRASTERNLLLLEARWLVLSGRDATTQIALAREHRWKCQGGASWLALGDALRDAGRLVEARECWALAIERDAESISAKHAARR